MSITSAEKTGLQEGTDEEISVTYKVITDGTDEPDEILEDDDYIPQRGDRYARGSVLTCLRRSARANSETDRTLWVVEVTYGCRDSSASGGTLGSASGRIQQLSVTSRTYDDIAEEGYFEDATVETPITNSAGDLFDPPIQRSVANAVLQLTQRENASFNPQRAIVQLHTINTAAITIAGFKIAAKKALMLRVDPSLQSDGTYVTSYEIEIATSVPFAKRLLDQGYRYKDANGLLREIRLSDINEDEYGEDGDSADKDKFLSDPVPLNGSGGILAAGGTPVFREYRINEYSDWNTTLDLVKRPK